MNLYDKVRNAECEIPESFDMGADQLIDFAQHSQGRYDQACIAFKFGYMQGCRKVQKCRTNKASGKRTESEAERLRRYICEMASQIRSERRLRQIYTIVHGAFINDGLEVLNERQD